MVSLCAFVSMCRFAYIHRTKTWQDPLQPLHYIFCNRTSTGSVLVCKRINMQAQNDEYYIEQVRGGNIAAFETLINRYKGMTMNLAIRIVRNREDAEEVAQDAFLKAFKAIHDFRSDSRFSTWLYSIVYRTAVSKTRKKIIDTADIDDHLISDKIAVHIDDQLEEMKATERKHYLRKALDELAQDESALLTLYYLEEQSVEEIVQITGLTESNVKTKLYRARKKLMLILEGMLKNEIRSIL